MILGTEGRKGFVKLSSRHLDRGQRHLLGREEDLIGRLEDVFICGVVENHVADMCPNADRQLKMPQSLHGCRAAAILQFVSFFADIID